MKLHPVELERLTPEILHVFGRQPPLLTAGDKTGLNTMTIGWCQLGRLWNLPVCTVYVRPERYTYQFMAFTFAIREAAFRGDNSGGHLGFRMLGKQ